MRATDSLGGRCARFWRLRLATGSSRSGFSPASDLRRRRLLPLLLLLLFRPGVNSESSSSSSPSDETFFGRRFLYLRTGRHWTQTQAVADPGTANMRLHAGWNAQAHVWQRTAVSSSPTVPHSVHTPPCEIAIGGAPRSIGSASPPSLGITTVSIGAAAAAAAAGNRLRFGGC